MLMANGEACQGEQKGSFKRGMNCLLGIEIGVFGGPDGLGVDWLSDGDCLNPSREIRDYRVLERPVQTGR